MKTDSLVRRTLGVALFQSPLGGLIWAPGDNYVAFMVRYGSSPRVQGTPTAAPRRFHPSRFIPACAGNTPVTMHRRSSTTVHPRVCREHSARPPTSTSPRGSSPRVQGTHGKESEAVVESRFIPACAGNTRLYWVVHRPPPVHPRVCREHRPLVPSTVEQYGSSPRVQGTRNNVTMT
jgi:hypothetical protein